MCSGTGTPASERIVERGRDRADGGSLAAQFVKAYNFRSDRHSVLVRPFANKWLNLAIAWELAALALVVYRPVPNRPFGTFPLTVQDWIIVASAAFTVAPVLELAKWMERRGWFGSLES
jgi:Ca2+-transporting ATPase